VVLARGRRSFSPMRLFFPLLILLLACGTSAPGPTDGGGGNGDLAQPASSGCQARADCRLFSSYCTSAPCQCFALARGDHDPACSSGTQTCIVDPCANKTVDCQAGACVLGP
jgi:hypothetical protein